MQSPNWKSLAELLGTAAIIVGLLLVFFELRQGHAFARAELSAESGRLMSEIHSQQLDPEFATVLAKSRTRPSELSQTERIQLNAFFGLVLNLYVREWYNYHRGFFENYTDFPRATAASFFGYGYGKAYWEYRRTRFVPELVQVVDRYSQDPEHVRYFEMMDKKTVESLPQ